MTGRPVFSVHFAWLFLNRHMIVWFSWIISICKIYGEYRTAGHLVFSTSSPTVELKKIPSVTKHGFVFSAQCEPNIILEIYKAFQDRLTFLNRHMIVWFSWICSICEIYWKDRTAGHLVFWKPWPVTGHIATAFDQSCVNRTETVHGTLRFLFSFISPIVWSMCENLHHESDG